MFRPSWRMCCASSMAMSLMVAAISPAFCEDGGLPELASRSPVLQSLPAHRVVVRISDAMLASFLAGEIEQQVAVNDFILGTHVAGTARIVGEPRVKLVEQADGAAFDVEFRGTAVSRTIGRNGPAIIHSRSVTHFVATKKIRYEAGHGFSGEPAAVSAQTQCFTEGLASTRRGVIDRIVRRKAAEQIAETKPLTTEIARQKAQHRIAAAFERRMDERIAHLNRLAETRSLLTSLGGSSGKLPYACGSTSQHLNIAAAHREALPICLPVRGSVSSLAAPVEVWVHHSLVPKAPPPLARQLQRASAALDIAGAVAFPGLLAKKQAIEAGLAGLATNVACSWVDDWLVVEVITDDAGLGRTAAAPAALR